MHSHVSLALFAICALLPANALCQRPPDPPHAGGNGFSVAGVVVQSGSNQALKHVQVSLISVEHRDTQLSCVTSENGQFTFSGLAAGKYSLQAQLHGFAQAYRENEDYSTAIVVGPNLNSEHITFLFDAPAAISGTVMDLEGDPIRDAQVFLFHRGISSGRHRTMMQAQTNTDSSGAFHFGQLRPGTYFVAVSARPWYAVNSPVQVQSDQNSGQSAGAAELDVAYPVTYYPDSLDAAGASPITLSQGGSAELSIALRPVPALHLDLNTNTPQQGMNVRVFAAGPGDAQLPTNAVQFNQENRQEILGLAPGHYVLTLDHFEQGSTGNSRTKAIDLTSNATLDLDDLPKTSVSGQVQLEGAERPNGLSVWLVNVNSGRATGGSVAGDGSFKLGYGSVSPGQYAIRLGNTPELYIKSVAVQGADYSRGILNVVEGAAIQMSVVVAKGLARVNGMAIKDGKPFPGAMVLLFPQGAQEGGYIPRDQSDSDGTFTLQLTPPGRYALVAIDDGRGLAYRDSSIIAPYLQQAPVINVPLPANASVKVNVQPRRR
jgi:Carboxypeptidase regulatory-like domain